MFEQVSYVTPMIVFCDLGKEDKGRKLRARRVKNMQMRKCRTSHALAIVIQYPLSKVAFV